MTALNPKSKLQGQWEKKNREAVKEILNTKELVIYDNSVFEYSNILFFIAREKSGKYLYLLYEDDRELITSRFEGEKIPLPGKNYFLKKCRMNTINRRIVQEYFEFTRPGLTGFVNSFGFGDRIGLANPAHLRSLENSDFVPVLAQQSIRELLRTNRSPADVMDSAVWAVFQEGYTNGFGADADHLKDTADIDLMVENGFTMFTFDPGEYVHNEADTLTGRQLDEVLMTIIKNGTADYSFLEKDYTGKKIKISPQLQLEAKSDDLKKAIIKYGDALVHINKLYHYLKDSYPDYQSEVEISVDETESVTSPFEHYFIANELKRSGIKIVSLAPRFLGSFEKGIDYKGDLDIFRQEYIKHIDIAKYFGTYKISMHSGSDKFSVYKIIGELNDGLIHIKTAGTSYLEALKVAAVKEPSLFREILDYCTGLYDNEKKSYHVSADLNKIKPAVKYSDNELPHLFNDNNIRQVLHVTYGRILTDKNGKGEYIFKEKLIECLMRNEEIHYQLIINHFLKHLDPFKYEKQK